MKENLFVAESIDSPKISPRIETNSSSTLWRNYVDQVWKKYLETKSIADKVRETFQNENEKMIQFVERLEGENAKLRQQIHTQEPEKNPWNDEVLVNLTAKVYSFRNNEKIMI